MRGARGRRGGCFPVLRKSPILAVMTMPRHLIPAHILLGAWLLLSGAGAGEARAAPPPDPASWAFSGGDAGNHRFSPLSEIDRGNVGGLRPVWSFSTGVLRGHEGAPLVVNGVMFLVTPFPNVVFALDLDHDGRILWKYAPRQDPSVIAVMCCDTVSRGLAYGDGKILLAQADTTVAALDAATGRLLWSVRNGDPKRGETLTAAPMVFKDKVLVGISGGEFGIEGRITAYRLKDGSPAWTAWSVGPDERLLFDDRTTTLGKPVGRNTSLASWQGDQWKQGGAPSWGWYSYDPALDLVYYGSGNPGTWNPLQRPGDNKWSDTIFARDADTGIARWVYQMTPHDEWDYDGVNEMILADIPVRGVETRALVHFDRNGFAYALNRETGELLSAEKFDPSVNWAARIDLSTGRPERVREYSPEAGGEDRGASGICPSALGAKNEAPAAFSPATGLFYVPGNHLCMDYEPFRVFYAAGEPYVGATLTMFPPKGETNLGLITAWDAGKGGAVWSKPEPFAVWSGPLVTAGGLLFYGTLEGYLKALDAETGKELWRYRTPSGIVGNVISYRHRGKQYIAVLSGIGGWAGIGLAAGLTQDSDGSGAVGAFRALSSYTRLGGVLTVFALP